MPVMSGYEATRALARERAGSRRLPIIALTAAALVSEREQALASQDGRISHQADRHAQGCTPPWWPPWRARRNIGDPATRGRAPPTTGADRMSQRPACRRWTPPDADAPP